MTASEEYPSSPPATMRRHDRKRRRDQHQDILEFSSDPPVFSSDPPDAALDADRRKRTYRGTWWGDCSTKQHDLSRNFDSGVFMPSDDSLPSLDPVPIKMLPLKKQHQPRHRTMVAKEHAQAIINAALEKGDEIVDLSGLDLPTLDPAAPRALQSLIKIPRFFDGPESPHEQEYRSLAPSIQLFLANNALSSLPPSLWSLQNLTVLSLRNNAITSIPASIAQLTNLEELNLANNKLRWLPWELLRLLGPGKPLTKLHLRPNPFFIGIDAASPFIQGHFKVPATTAAYQQKLHGLAELANPIDCQSPQPSSPARWLHKLMAGLWHVMDTVDSESLQSLGPPCLWTASAEQFAFSSLHVATTRPCFFEKDGTVMPDKKALAPSRAPLHERYLLADPYAIPDPSRQTSRVPSLLELAMVQCGSSPQLRQLPDMLSVDGPLPVLRALQETCAAVDEGGRLCSVCSRRYYIPRCEWIEYWHCIPRNPSAISPEEMFWPFLRRGCSWACVP